MSPEQNTAGEQPHHVDDVLALIMYDATLAVQVTELVPTLLPDLEQAGIPFAETTMQNPELREEAIRVRSSAAHSEAESLRGDKLTEEETNEVDERLATALLEESANNSAHLMDVASALALAKNAEASGTTVASRLMIKKLMQAYTLALGLDTAWLAVINEHFPGDPLTEDDSDYVQAIKDELLERQQKRDDYLNTMGAAALPTLSVELDKEELSELDFDILADMLGSWYDRGKHKTDGDIQSWLEQVQAYLVEHDVDHMGGWMRYAMSLAQTQA
jgi:hypothetical protein